MKIVPVFAAALGLGAISSSAAAEMPPWSQEMLNREPLIVRGVITKIGRHQFPLGECQLDIETIFSIRVDGGGGEKSGRSYVVSAHNNEWSCSDRLAPAGPSGVWLARGLKVGDHAKIYASPAGGGEYTITAPNGMQMSN